MPPRTGPLLLAGGGHAHLAVLAALARGFVKMLTRPRNDRTLAVTIVGEHAGSQLRSFLDLP